MWNLVVWNSKEHALGCLSNIFKKKKINYHSICKSSSIFLALLEHLSVLFLLSRYDLAFHWLAFEPSDGIVAQDTAVILTLNNYLYDISLLECYRKLTFMFGAQRVNVLLSISKKYIQGSLIV